MTKPKRTRFARRAAARRVEKLYQDRQKLARLEAGGSPERPLEVESASVVEMRAQSFACLRCDAPVRVSAHVAEEIGGGPPLRVVTTTCSRCGAGRTFYVRILGSLLN